MLDPSLNSLFEILRDYDVRYDRDAIKSVCEDPKCQTAIQGWMEEYLGPETLLTREEAAL